MTPPRPTFISYSFNAKLWKYVPKNQEDKGSWVFVTVPKTISKKIKTLTSKKPRRGFGAVKVVVTIGTTRWGTSMFPDSSKGAYILPIKAQIRKQAHIEAEDTVEVTIEIVGTFEPLVTN